MFIQPKFWKTLNSTAILLWPLAFAYGVISRLKYKLQAPISFKPTKVICIGNATVGGSGKTPLAIALGKVLLDLKIEGLRKIKLAYACRNYGAQASQASQGYIPKQPKDIEDYRSAGVIEEALLLARIAPTFVSRHRLDAIKAACGAANVVITDDGLQNNSFAKDLSILAVPEDKSFGNRLIFPSGPMRETFIDSLQKSDFVFLMNECGASHASSLRIIKQHFDIAKVFSTVYLYHLYNRTSVIGRRSELRKKRFLAFCGIANPDRFFDALRRDCFDVVERETYPNHHRYSEQDLRRLESKARLLSACLITTEKDIVKLSDKWQNQVMYLKLEVCIR